MVLLFRNVHDNFRDIHIAHFDVNPPIEPTYKDLDIGNWELFTCPATGASGMIQDNLVTSTFMSGHSGRELIYVSQYDSEIDSLIYNRALITNQQFRDPQNYPQIAGSNDTIGVVWQARESPFRKVYFTYSTNGVDDLGNEIFLLSEGINGNQVNPDIAFEDGVFHMTWQNNADAAVMYKTFVIDRSTSYHDFSDSAIQLSPSPMGDRITIRSSKGWRSCTILDSRGRTIDRFDNTANYSVSHLTPGLYYFQFLFENGQSQLVKALKQ